MHKRFVYMFLLCLSLCGVSRGQTTGASIDLSNDSSITYFKKLFAKNNKSSFALYGLASAYYARNDFNNAVLYSKLNLKNKNDFDTACNLIYACSLDRTGRITEAIDEFEKSIKEYPNSYILWYQYALSCYKYRNHTKAQAALKRSISINPYFVEQHYLMGCSMFENNNDANCIYPFLYGLMLDNDSARASNAIFFVKTYLEKKPDQINIPFFESRLAITSLADILSYYFPVKSKWQMAQNIQSIDLFKTIELYLSSNYPQKDGIYSEFNNSIQRDTLSEQYIYYCLRSMRNEYVTLWFKNHSVQLKIFAEFLERNLITK